MQVALSPVGKARESCSFVCRPCHAPCPPYAPALVTSARRIASTTTRSEIDRLVARHRLPSAQQRAVGLRQRGAGIAEAIDDRIATVAAEVLERDLDARRR